MRIAGSTQLGWSRNTSKSFLRRRLVELHCQKSATVNETIKIAIDLRD
jgi:hypothetical protein